MMRTKQQNRKLISFLKQLLHCFLHSLADSSDSYIGCLVLMVRRLVTATNYLTYNHRNDQQLVVHANIEIASMEEPTIMVSKNKANLFQFRCVKKAVRKNSADFKSIEYCCIKFAKAAMFGNLQRLVCENIFQKLPL